MECFTPSAKSDPPRPANGATRSDCSAPAPFFATHARKPSSRCGFASLEAGRSVVPKLGKGSPGQPGVPRRRAQAPSSDLDLASRMELPMQDDKMAPQVHSEPGNINRLTTATGAELVGSGPALP
ncbi:hypothetical protein ACCO45_004107 [Purpureocillium lilacinum]|uniref:Uncharacterized protein n=1 Tax=Purpureocillium lilacinum TaxID=33203 RepID=A0ACC4E1T5_PURLI